MDKGWRNFWQTWNLAFGIRGVCGRRTYLLIERVAATTVTIVETHQPCKSRIERGSNPDTFLFRMHAFQACAINHWPPIPRNLAYTNINQQSILNKPQLIRLINN